MRTFEFLRRAVLGLVASTIAAVVLGTPTALAEPPNLAPSTVTAGGSVTISANDWVGPVTITFLKDNTVLQAGVADAGPNGGPFSVVRSAPTEPGNWQVCLDGTTVATGGAYECSNLTVNAVPTTTATVPTSTATSTTLPGSTTTSTTVPDSTTTTPFTVPPTSAPPTAPPTSAPVTLPGSPDGSVVLDEPAGATDGSGLSGLTIGLLVAVGVLTAIGVVGMLSSGIGDRPRPAGAIGVVVVGALVGGALVIVMPPPKVNVPKLAITRVQTSATVDRNSSQTVTANCPAGSVVVGGGWSSDWSSTRIDDPQPLVKWMETERASRYVLPRGRVILSNGQPLTAYWYVARGDETVHFSDQVWDSNTSSWLYLHLIDIWDDDAIEDRGPRPEVIDIPYRPDVAQAFAAEYYRAMDEGLGRSVGTLVKASIPVEQGWRVTASLSPASLQTSMVLTVVANCAPLATDTGQPGVLGATIRSFSSAGSFTVPCTAGETATAVGFTAANSAGVSTARVDPDLRSTSFLAMNGADTATAVCVKSTGLEVRMASASSTMTGGFDGSVTATCPSGFTVLGGGMTFTWKPLGGGANSRVQAVSAALPIGSKSYGVSIRPSAFHDPTSPATGSALIDVPDGKFAFPLVAFANHDMTEVAVDATCGRRVP